MLSTLDLKLDTNGERLRFGQTGLFHGWLMSHLPMEVAEDLHQSRIHPYSQYLFYDGEYWVWRINTLSRSAKEGVIDAILDSNLTQIELNHSEKIYKILSADIQTISYGELFERNYLDRDGNPNVSFKIITPTTFKSGGKYVRFPEPHYVFGSLMNRFDAFAGNMILGDQSILEQVDERINIGKYRLSSSAFPLEGIRIPSFKGSITFCPRGNKQFVSMIHMLADFAAYSGIGIKTSLGMGAVEHVREERIVRD